MTDKKKLLPLGIHFGLSFDAYLSDPGLGSSQVKELNIDPLTYWWNSPMGPPVERVETEAQRFGTAMHKIMLEGVKAFDNMYSVAPRKEDHKGLLVTIDDLKEWLKKRGHKATGTKATLIDAALSAGCMNPIWDRIDKAHKADCEASGKTSLDPATADQILIRARVIWAEPAVARLLSDGFSEVSVFWEDDAGIRWKARVDYMRRKDQTDLKTFSNQYNEPTERCITKSIARYQYHIQARHHWTGVQAAKDMIIANGANAVFAYEREPAPDQKWLIDFAATPPGPVFWIFAQSTGAPIVRALRCPQSTAKERSEIWEDAAQKMTKARSIYQDCKKRFGPDEAWIETEAPNELQDWNFPVWMVG